MKTYKVKVNGKSYIVELESIEESAKSITNVKKETTKEKVEKKEPSKAVDCTEILSPIQGNVIDVKVSVGQKVKKGDILIASELSRLGRNLLEVMGILQNCLEKDCQIWTLKENYRLGNDIQSKILAFAFGLAAEIERNLISQRTKSSLANLKATGKKLGRPLAAESQKLKLSKNSKKIRNLLSKGVSKSQIAKILGVQRSTLRRFIERNKYFN